MGDITPLPSRAAEPLVALHCKRPACSRTLDPDTSSRGRPREYCSRECRGLAEREYQTAISAVRRAQMVVDQFGRTTPQTPAVRSTRHQPTADVGAAMSSLRAAIAGLGHDLEMLRLRDKRTQGPRRDADISAALNAFAGHVAALRAALLELEDTAD